MAKFVSKCPNQVICYIPNRVQVLDGIAVQQPGKHIRFDRGDYETKDPKEIGFLRKHQLYGNAIAEVEESIGSK